MFWFSAFLYHSLTLPLQSFCRRRPGVDACTDRSTTKTTSSTPSINGEEAPFPRVKGDLVDWGKDPAFNYTECYPYMCTSRGPDGHGHNCWAGSIIEACSCDGGLSAKLTGVQTLYEGTPYYEYTCCKEQWNSDGKVCGDYAVPMIVYSCFGACIGLSALTVMAMCIFHILGYK